MLGVRRDLTGALRPPGEATVRRVLARSCPPPSKNTDAHLSLKLIAPASLSKIAAEQSHHRAPT